MVETSKEFPPETDKSNQKTGLDSMYHPIEPQEAVNRPAEREERGERAEDVEGEIINDEDILEIRKADDENLLDVLLRRRSKFLGFIVPLLIISLLFTLYFERFLYRLIIQSPSIGPLFAGHPYLVIASIWAIIIGAFIAFYYFLYQFEINQTKIRINRLEHQLQIKKLETERGRVSYLRSELFNVTAKTAKEFFENEKRYEQASQWRRMAGDALDSATSTSKLSDVQTYLNALNELINRERREKREQQYWQIAAIFIIILYIAGLLTVVFYTDTAKSNMPAPVFGVPLSVIMWGAAGSLAAILFRFYNEKGRIRFASEFRWLIARPITGIIMGAVVYLAIISGLALLGTTSSSGEGTVGEQNGRIEAYWVIAFLAGFSDKFYIGVIDLLVARTTRREEVGSNKTITEKERVQEPS